MPLASRPEKSIKPSPQQVFDELYPIESEPARTQKHAPTRVVASFKPHEFMDLLMEPLETQPSNYNHYKYTINQDRYNQQPEELNLSRSEITPSATLSHRPAADRVLKRTIPDSTSNSKSVALRNYEIAKQRESIGKIDQIASVKTSASDSPSPSSLASGTSKQSLSNSNRSEYPVEVSNRHICRWVRAKD